MTRPTSFDELPLVMTIENVSQVLMVSKSIAYLLARSEQLRCIHVGQRLRILRSDLERYLTGGVPYPECQPDLASLPLLLTVPDLQPILQLGRNSVLELIHTEQIRSIRVSRQIRILKHELQLFLAGAQESYRDDMVPCQDSRYDSLAQPSWMKGGV